MPLAIGAPVVTAIGDGFITVTVPAPTGGVPPYFFELQWGIPPSISSYDTVDHDGVAAADPAATVRTASPLQASTLYQIKVFVSDAVDAEAVSPFVNASTPPTKSYLLFSTKQGLHYAFRLKP